MSSTLRIAVVAAVPVTLHAFMRLHLEAMASVYPTTAICGGEQSAIRDLLPPSVAFRHVPIQRKISPFRDLVALWKLVTLFCRERYTLVHSITPKAGLLAMCAAFLCGVPFRVHVFTGQVWATKSGLSRLFLKTLDRLIAVLATHVLADSKSQRQFLIDQGVVRPDRIKVLADGSICGVDAKRFKPAPDVRTRLRAELQLPDEAVVALFLGRLTRDKGVLDLANAFVRVAADCPDFYLLVVGPDEECLTPVLQEIFAPCADHVRFVGMTDRPEDYMAVADIFCLPSYREGFGSVIIEAAATGVPAVASRIYGLTDAVDDGETGLLHVPAEVSSIDATLRILVSDADLRARMGARARERAVTLFSSARVVAAQMAFYEDLFGSASDRGSDLANTLQQGRKPMGYTLFKRLFDLGVALLLFLILSPLILLVAIAIRAKMGAPVLFRQVRPGLNGEPFSVFKFRTMLDATDSSGQPLPDAARLTTLGKWLRRLSLDELPQLINVLIGDMSLVGPRPLLVEYLPLYSPEQARRHEVRPGISGWAQVNGRNAIDWETRLALDVWYVDHACFSLDMRILLMTVSKVLSRHGVNAPGEATVSKFGGAGRSSRQNDEGSGNE